jgi:hypothetical protein
MIKTSDLVVSLAANLTPVRRLRPPIARATLWLLLAAVVLALLAISQGVRPDLMEKVKELSFDTSLIGSLLTGVFAAAAAFLVSLPDRSRLWLLLPLPTLVFWLSNIGYQCLADWINVGPEGISLGEAARCFATLALTSLPLSLAMLVMLRYAAPLRPTAVSFMGGLAVAAIAATALALFHAIDASAMILMWNFGVAALLAGLGGLSGPRMFQWVGPRAASIRG